ncbi:chemotaxis protein CheW [Dissulfurirhabdus thermomarina]|uniref:Chemotaxis protein CheW n=1 Tax=Dissulfurirhabdus thermomarina TaxID=1765737 RepID=A0A6N9TPM1_DISTH|nr:chemotaxis protein CheW [Dissulfurirhabdus thermomarina]NDY43222.1 chemotaxis protein CheW [Dissulfurirhabdus thermomarina]NMX23223.1 chemotaxis protein CheW [Dissulfurirhabdus thermomarina]
MNTGMEEAGRIPVDPCWQRVGTWAPGGPTCPELAEAIHCRNCEAFARAARILLDRPLDPDRVAEVTRDLAEEAREIARGDRSALVFRVGPEWIGIPAAFVSEVTAMAPIHSVPRRRNRVFRGIVNVRGRLEVCVSLGGLLGVERQKEEDREVDRLVVATWNGESFVFPVSQVRGILRYWESDLRRVPDTVGHSREVYTRGLIPAEGGDVALLDWELVFRGFRKSLT